MQLHISVTSKNATESELIDNFFIELDITANDPLSPSREYSGENETAVMRLSFRVACAFNYFGLDCNTFCMDRNDTAAHFTCGESGEIVCLQGYQNESSNCTQCAPAEGCCTLIPIFDYVCNSSTPLVPATPIVYVACAEESSRWRLQCNMTIVCIHNSIILCVCIK